MPGRATQESERAGTTPRNKSGVSQQSAIARGRTDEPRAVRSDTGGWWCTDSDCVRSSSAFHLATSSEAVGCGVGDTGFSALRGIRRPVRNTEFLQRGFNFFSRW